MEPDHKGRSIEEAFRQIGLNPRDIGQYRYNNVYSRVVEYKKVADRRRMTLPPNLVADLEEYSRSSFISQQQPDTYDGVLSRRAREERIAHPENGVHPYIDALETSERINGQLNALIAVS